MDNKEICTDFVISVLRELHNICEAHKYCTSECYLYNQNSGMCLLMDYPEYYDLKEIEKRIIKIIQDEMKKDGETNDFR